MDQIKFGSQNLVTLLKKGIQKRLIKAKLARAKTGHPLATIFQKREIELSISLASIQRAFPQLNIPIVD